MTTPLPLAPSSSQLCQQCGMCCDGTIFRRTIIEPSDNRGNADMLQPCSQLQNISCTIYSDRPNSCIGFKCDLLTQFENSQIPYAECLQIIRRTQMITNRIRAATQCYGEAIWSYYDRMRNDLPNQFRQLPQETLFDFAELRLMLIKYFRKNF